MKIYVMTDMEGVAGVLDHDNWCQPPGGAFPGLFYGPGRELLTREVNAAVAGLCAGGADEIVVADGHGAGGIDPTLLDPRARLMRGWPNGWPLGLDKTCDAVAWVGQHAKAGTPHAHIAHTQWFNWLDHRLNGVSIGEFGQFALCAGELGIPCIFGSGDQAFCHEADALAPGIKTVAVKEGTQRDDGADLDTDAYMHHSLGAIHLHPTLAREAIEQGALDAMRRLGNAPAPDLVVKLDPPYEQVIRYRPDRPGEPRRVFRASHSGSISALFNIHGDALPE